jgi:predicted enzyme related to lactoylglutathione lyase
MLATRLAVEPARSVVRVRLRAPGTARARAARSMVSRVRRGDRKKRQDIGSQRGYSAGMSRFVLCLCALLVPGIAIAQPPTASGAPVVYFSLFGPNGSELQRFYTGVFDWKIAANGDVATTVAPPLTGTIGQGAPETIVYLGVTDVTATLQKVVASGGTIRFPRFEVKGRVVLGVFKDPAGNSVGLVEMENGKAKVP